MDDVYSVKRNRDAIEATGRACQADVRIATVLPRILCFLLGRSEISRFSWPSMDIFET